jgi:hypothetical protein
MFLNMDDRTALILGIVFCLAGLFVLFIIFRKEKRDEVEGPNK